MRSRLDCPGQRPPHQTTRLPSHALHLNTQPTLRHTTLSAQRLLAALALRASGAYTTAEPATTPRQQHTCLSCRPAPGRCIPTSASSLPSPCPMSRCCRSAACSLRCCPRLNVEHAHLRGRRRRSAAGCMSCSSGDAQRDACVMLEPWPFPSLLFMAPQLAAW